jgi:mannosyl-oligosaccharide alpha-1,3-glucosidase
VFPKDKNGFELDDQFFVGSSGLLVKPVTEKDVKETKIYIPGDQVCSLILVFLSFLLINIHS